MKLTPEMEDKYSAGFWDWWKQSGWKGYADPDSALEAWIFRGMMADQIESPHPIVTQPETNLPISGLGGYDQVLRDEFEDGKK
jgi:hypothetical protein